MLEEGIGNKNEDLKDNSVKNASNFKKDSGRDKRNDLDEKTETFEKIKGKGDKLVLYVVIGVGTLLIFTGFIYAVSSLNYWKDKDSLSPLADGDGLKTSIQKENNNVSGGDYGEIPSPINGSYTPKDSESVWTKRRPLGIMINNHTEARPQKCLQNADIVYEAVAEGGITRFLAIFLTKDCDIVGPIRSARVYYEDWLAEYQGIYAHWGAAYQDPNDPNVTFPEADAYLKINELNLPDLDQMWVGDSAYWREDRPGKALEHTGYASTSKLWDSYVNKYPEADWRIVMPFDSWSFKDDISESERASSAVLEFNFWDLMPGYNVKWEYNKQTNTYKRYQGGEPIKDEDSGAEAQAKTIIMQFTQESRVGDLKNHLLYQTLGSGDAKIYMDGKETTAKWSKSSSRSRTKYLDASGSPVKLNRGQIWVEIVPTGNTISYQSSN